MRDPVEQFVGAWQLVLWTTHRADGTEISPSAAMRWGRSCIAPTGI